MTLTGHAGRTMLHPSNSQKCCNKSMESVETVKIHPTAGLLHVLIAKALISCWKIPTTGN